VGQQKEKIAFWGAITPTDFRLGLSMGLIIIPLDLALKEKDVK